jgi:eukaryotic-like serine/threonine-protein kinase
VFVGPGLRAEVESLISASEEPGSFLDTPAYKLPDGRIDPAESLIGRSIGQYEIISLIGQGAMGDVYLARDRRLDRNVALKLLPLEFTANEIRMRRLPRP